MQSYILTFSVLVVLYALCKRRPKQRKSDICLVGKTALVTGAARGIGFHVALGLATRGCRVIIADVLDAEEARRAIVRRTNNNNIIAKHLDLASLESVRTFAEEITESEARLDILVNNAGIGPRKPRDTKDGLDLTMQTNYFGAFLLTYLLVDLLKKSAPSRILFTSSVVGWLGDVSHGNPNRAKSRFWSYQSGQLYCNSKLCNIIAADGFAVRLERYNVASNSVRPFAGSATGIFDECEGVFLKIGSLFLHSFCEHPVRSAKHVIYTCVAKELEGISGRCFTNSRECWKPWQARNKDLCEAIWATTEKLVGIKSNELLAK